MDWIKTVKNFHLIIENGSFSKASKSNYTSSSSLSKQINWLEYELKTTLIKRSTRSLSLTEEGAKFYSESKIIIQDFENLIKKTQEKAKYITGQLTVAAPKTFGQVVLSKHINKFIEKHPQIKINLKLDNNYQDLINEGIDIAIRTQNIKEKTLISEDLGYKRKGVFIAPSLLKKIGNINSPDDLRNTPCLTHTDFDNFGVWKFKGMSIHINPLVSSNELKILLDLALDAKGIIYISEYVVQPYIKNKKLMPILQEFWPEPTLHSLVYPRSKYITEKTSKFIEFIKDINF